MRFRVFTSGAPEEGAELLKSVAEDLDEVLQKALPRKETNLKYKALRHIQDRSAKLYAKQMKAMRKEINAALDNPVQKSRLPILDNLEKAGKASKEDASYAFHQDSFYSCNTCVHWVPGGPNGRSGEPDRCHLHSSEDLINSNGNCRFFKHGEPVPGREPKDKTSIGDSGYHENEYHTGFRCNRCKHYVKGGSCKKIESEGTPHEGYIVPEATCILWDVVHNKTIPLEVSTKLQKSDHTKMIADEDAKKYERVKTVFKQSGWTEEDFTEEDGLFYGWSVNELLEYVKEKGE